MQIINATSWTVGFTVAGRADGSEALVVIIKGAFTIPADGGQPQPVPVSPPLCATDVYEGEPGLSPPVYECDFAAHKERCDVVVTGIAHAPGGVAVLRFPVHLHVGEHIDKRFWIIGDRIWKKGWFGIAASDPQPVSSLPLSYASAFGGSDHSHADPSKHGTFLANPLGRGWHSNRTRGALAGKPLPNTESDSQPIKQPQDMPAPMGLGPIGRGWQPRIALAGTYDKSWLDDGFPLLPPDFQDEHYQCAPPDQQMPHPVGGEPITLGNLTPSGHLTTAVPTGTIPVLFMLHDGTDVTAEAVLDTIHIDAVALHMTTVWRTMLPLPRGIFAVHKTLVGTMPPSWHRARRLGKTWYANAAALIDAKRSAGEGADA